MQEIFFLLLILQIKHWFVDFVNQSQEEINTKGIYGHGIGLMHSAKHGVGTALCILIVFGIPYMLVSIMVGFLDFILHYHIDFVKMKFGNRDITNPAFWTQLGLDQMAHQMTYLGIAYILI
jgi:hypothetical protein